MFYPSFTTFAITENFEGKNKMQGNFGDIRKSVTVNEKDYTRFSFMKYTRGKIKHYTAYAFNAEGCRKAYAYAALLDNSEIYNILIVFITNNIKF